MMAPMRKEQGDITRHSEFKKKTYKVRNAIILTLGGLALSSGGFGATYGALKSITSIERTLDKTYLHVSFDKLERARGEILIFDQNIHDLISADSPSTDLSSVDQEKAQKARDAITLINQEQTISQQRQELRERLSKDKSQLAFGGELMGLLFGSVLVSAGVTLIIDSAGNLVPNKR